MSDDDGRETWREVFAFMAKQELEFLSSLEGLPRVVHAEPGSTAEHCRIRGYVARHRSHPRCGQDDDPPFWYMLTERGRERLRELRITSVPESADAGQAPRHP